MKTLDINQLDDSDEELAKTLMSSGLSRPVSRTLAYLKKVDTATSVDLERGTGLRQPEVSIAMRQLNPFDWIEEDEEKKPGKGRPNKVYSLKVRFKDIIAHLEKEHPAENTLEKLRISNCEIFHQVTTFFTMLCHFSFSKHRSPV